MAIIGESSGRRIGRREFVAAGAALALGVKLGGIRRALEPIEVAYAGSMTSLMEDAIKPAAASLGIEFHGRAQGANALAQLIAGGSLRPDVFLAVTADPMQVVLAAGKTARATPVARTSMVIAYATQSRFATQLAHRGEPGAMPWWKILQEPGFRFGRTDPSGDPQGRNIIYVFELAERFYHQPGLAAKVLGPTINPAQVFSETTLEARLQSGQLDAASAYRIQPGPFHLPFVELPAEINLSQPPPEAAGVSVTITGKTYHPQALVYYAAVLREAPHAGAATRFASWLAGDAAQALFRQYGYEPRGAAAALQA